MLNPLTLFAGCGRAPVPVECGEEPGRTARCVGGSLSSSISFSLSLSLSFPPLSSLSSLPLSSPSPSPLSLSLTHTHTLSLSGWLTLSVALHAVWEGLWSRVSGIRFRVPGLGYQCEDSWGCDCAEKALHAVHSFSGLGFTAREPDNALRDVDSELRR